MAFGLKLGTCCWLWPYHYRYAWSLPWCFSLWLTTSYLSYSHQAIYLLGLRSSPTDKEVVWFENKIPLCPLALSPAPGLTCVIHLPETDHFPVPVPVPGAAVTRLKGRAQAEVIAMVGNSEPHQSCASCSTRKGTFAPSFFSCMLLNQSAARWPFGNTDVRWLRKAKAKHHVALEKSSLVRGYTGSAVIPTGCKLSFI